MPLTRDRSVDHPRRSRDIEHWDAEDVDAWDAGGKDVAKRNLIWSIVAEHVGFSVWSIWSVMVLFMPVKKYGSAPGIRTCRSTARPLAA